MPDAHLRRVASRALLLTAESRCGPRGVQLAHAMLSPCRRYAPQLRYRPLQFQPPLARPRRSANWPSWSAAPGRSAHHLQQSRRRHQQHPCSGPAQRTPVVDISRVFAPRIKSTLRKHSRVPGEPSPSRGPSREAPRSGDPRAPRARRPRRLRPAQSISALTTS